MDDDRDSEQGRPRAVEPWLRRNVTFPGSAPAFADSPLADLWAEADDSRADAAEAIARLREERRSSGA